MAHIAAPLEIGGRGRASGDMGLAVFLLVAKAAAAIDAGVLIRVWDLALSEGVRNRPGMTLIDAVDRDLRS